MCVLVVGVPLRDEVCQLTFHQSRVRRLVRRDVCSSRNYGEFFNDGSGDLKLRKVIRNLHPEELISFLSFYYIIAIAEGCVLRS